MARTLLTRNKLGGSYTAVGLVTTPTASDVSNGNNFFAAGGEILLVRNSGATARLLTIYSVPDGEGRTGDMVESILAGETRAYEDNVIDILIENLERLWKGDQVLRNQVL